MQRQHLQHMLTGAADEMRRQREVYNVSKYWDEQWSDIASKPSLELDQVHKQGWMMS